MPAAAVRETINGATTLVHFRSFANYAMKGNRRENRLGFHPCAQCLFDGWNAHKLRCLAVAGWTSGSDAPKHYRCRSRGARALVDAAGSEERRSALSERPRQQQRAWKRCTRLLLSEG